jgi:hypothetical protein
MDLKQLEEYMTHIEKTPRILNSQEDKKLLKLIFDCNPQWIDSETLSVESLLPLKQTLQKSFTLGMMKGVEMVEDKTKQLSSHRFTGMYAEFARQGYDTCVKEILFNIYKLKQELK